MTKTFYTYELIDPRTHLPFYVGKGKNYRMYFHMHTVKNNMIPNNNKRLYDKLKQLIDEDLEPIYNKILETNNEQDAFNKEIEKIAEIGIENLCNMTDGGEGSSNRIPWNKGKCGYKIKPRSEESKMRSSIALKKSIKHKNSMENPDIRQKMKIGRRKYYKNGGEIWNKGLTKETDDRIEKYSNKLLGRTLSDEHRKNLSISHIGIFPGKKTREKMSASHRKQYEYE